MFRCHQCSSMFRIEDMVASSFRICRKCDLQNNYATISREHQKERHRVWYQLRNRCYKVLGRRCFKCDEPLWRELRNGRWKLVPRTKHGEELARAHQMVELYALPADTLIDNFGLMCSYDYQALIDKQEEDR